MSCIVWQLPRDILHTVYAEWLEWKDLSNLDIACIENTNREIWLASLRELMKKGSNKRSIAFHSPNNQVVRYYTWLGSRWVYCMEDFPVRLNVLKGLMKGIDLVSYCPILQSVNIEIHRGGSYELPEEEELKRDLSIFFSHCHHLQGVKFTSNFQEDTAMRIVLQTLNTNLSDNSLIKVDLHIVEESEGMAAHLLRKHASSLKELRLKIYKGIDMIVSALIDHCIRLRVLDVDVKEYCVQMEDWLVPYLSSAGDLLETLWAHCYIEEYSDIDYILVLLAESCPRLTFLDISSDGSSSAESLSYLFEKCTHLTDVFIRDTIITAWSTVTIEVLASDEYWVQCLSYALARRECCEVILELNESNYNPFGNLKSLLEPYSITLSTTAPEACLVSMMADLPHLNKFKLGDLEGLDYTDATLTAITQHAERLTEVWIQRYEESYSNQFSDTVMSEMIESCQQLTRLTISDCGMESLMAVSKHSNLRHAQLTMVESVTKEMLDELLLDEKVKWPLTLEEGSVISTCNPASDYAFNQLSRCWTILH